MIHVVVAIGKDWGGGYVHGVMKRYSWSIKEKQRQDDENISVAIIKQDLPVVRVYVYLSVYLHTYKSGCIPTKPQPTQGGLPLLGNGIGGEEGERLTFYLNTSERFNFFHSMHISFLILRRKKTNVN